MISLEQVTKYYQTDFGRRYILRGVNFQFEVGQHIALLGRNGSGKSTLMRMLGGAEIPNEGAIFRTSTVSWPLGNIGGFQGSLTGMENAEFVCQILGLTPEQTEEVVNFVFDFAEIGNYFFMPVNTYSAGMKGRVRFGLSLAFNFDFYLVDEMTSVGDVAFRAKAEEEFDKLRDHASIIFASHNLNAVVTSCDSAIILRDGEMSYYPDIHEGVSVYKEMYNLGKK